MKYYACFKGGGLQNMKLSAINEGTLEIQSIT